tara:strand:- start:355 stop:669 length:315 start_codon:yes stop_codon:yes gene_type:complete
MYRSQEIIQIFHKYNIPDEITKYILVIERQLLFENSWRSWIHISQLIKSAKCKRFFYEENNDFFLQEIRDIKGSFIILKENKEKIQMIKQNNHNYSNYLRSVRY